VFVVDAKNRSGAIRVRDVGGLFRKDERLFVGRRDVSGLADNLRWEAELVRRALETAMSVPPDVIPVLCFVGGEWPLFKPPTEFRGVRLEGTRSLVKFVAKGGPLQQPEIEDVARHLVVAFPEYVRQR
jgi:hypothetical protein